MLFIAQMEAPKRLPIWSVWIVVNGFLLQQGLYFRAHVLHWILASIRNTGNR